MMVVTAESHVDHGLIVRQLEWIKSRFSEADGFFIETIELPKTMGTVPCGLYGPIMGDPPSKGKLAIRGTRAGPTPMVDLPTRPTRQVTVIAGPSGPHKCLMYTAFGGPMAPREPWDSDIESENERATSIKFWSEHALSNQ